MRPILPKGRREHDLLGMRAPGVGPPTLFGASSRGMNVFQKPVNWLRTTKARLEFRGPADSILRGGDVSRGPNAGTKRAFVTDSQGRIVREITSDRVKARVSNSDPSGRTFETFEKIGSPTAEDLRILGQLE